MKRTKVSFRKALAESAVMNIDELMKVDMHSNARTKKLEELGRKLAEEARSEFNDVEDINKTFTTIRNAIRDMNVSGHLLHRRLGEVNEALENPLISDGERVMYRAEHLEGITTREIETVLKKWLGELSDKFDTCAKNGAPVSRTTALGKVHEALGHALGGVYPASFYVLVMSNIERESRKKRYSVQKESGLDNIIPININTYLELSERLLLAERWDDLAIGVAMATGRRMFEVLYSMGIEVPDSEKFDVLIDGLLKGAQRTGLSFGGGQVLIPVLVDPYAVKAALARLRKVDRVKACIDAINEAGEIGTNGRALAVQLNRRAKAILPVLSQEKEAKDWKFSDTRKMAWQAAYYFDKAAEDESGEHSIAYAKRYLGHTDIGTTEHYMAYKFFDKKVDSKSSEPEKLEVTLSDKINAPEVDEAVLKLASSGEFKEETVINTHERVCQFLKKNPDIKKITQGTLQKARKLGGVGAGHAMAKAYYSAVKEFIK